jgi:hypothetical protein
MEAVVRLRQSGGRARGRKPEPKNVAPGKPPDSTRRPA